MVVTPEVERIAWALLLDKLREVIHLCGYFISFTSTVSSVGKTTYLQSSVSGRGNRKEDIPSLSDFSIALSKQQSKLSGAFQNLIPDCFDPRAAESAETEAKDTEITNPEGQLGVSNLSHTLPNPEGRLGVSHLSHTL